ncbi:uridylate kinase [Methylobacterium sp. Leaf108]|uniref:amino acid kinase family protein n=1 Tax=Methylobacterium sp. Leaf108 TaxID=1736256 RepID=UPI0006F9CFE1|nr:uridylate kinase [Methylobacterium sp. Leaf108]KQP51381.1 uridylate kinase [Methylobacterium sp. Leaf108]
MPPEATPLSVVKVGGSLLADPARLARLLSDLAEGREGAVVVVPGGGGFADAVRAAQAIARFDDGEAHRRALDAMGRMAACFIGIEPRLRIAKTLAACRSLSEAGATPVWDPVMLRAGHPDIAESWAVTSDSLALWLAGEIGARACILEKSAAVPAGAGPAELAATGLVDAAFPDFARRFAGRIVVRGPGCAAPDRAAA